MGLGSKPGADRQGSNPFMGSAKQGGLQPWVDFSCQKSQNARGKQFLRTKQTRQLIFQWLSRQGRSEKESYWGFYLLNWESESRMESGSSSWLRNGSQVSWLLVLHQLCQAGGEWNPGILGQRQIHPDKGNRTVDTIFPLLGLGFPVRYPPYQMDIANIHRVIPYIHIYLLAVTPGAPSQL